MDEASSYRTAAFAPMRVQKAAPRRHHLGSLRTEVKRRERCVNAAAHSHPLPIVVFFGLQ
jgi:hypothetical protein